MFLSLSSLTRLGFSLRLGRAFVDGLHLSLGGMAPFSPALALPPVASLALSTPQPEATGRTVVGRGKVHLPHVSGPRPKTEAGDQPSAHDVERTAYVSWRIGQPLLVMNLVGVDTFAVGKSSVNAFAQEDLALFREVVRELYLRDQYNQLHVPSSVPTPGVEAELSSFKAGGVPYGLIEPNFLSDEPKPYDNSWILRCVLSARGISRPDQVCYELAKMFNERAKAVDSDLRLKLAVDDEDARAIECD